MEKELEILKTIKQVDAPHFLFTRIEGKLRLHADEYLNTKKTLLYLAGIACVIVLNIWIIYSQKPEPKQNLAAEMQLVESNQLYE